MPWYQYIKKRPFISAISILLVISILFGMYSCSITGRTAAPLQKVSVRVTDAITEGAVKGAKVTVGPSTMTTDADGDAQFELSASTYRYSVSAKGYQQTGDKIEVSQNGLSKSVEIVPDAIKKAGTYGTASGSQKTINGNVNLAADGITLQNMKIKGNLTVDSAVGDGTVALKHLNVEGTATVKGGGSHSVHVDDCTFTSVIIDKSGVHVVMQGGTTAKVIDVKSQASLDASGVSSSNLPVAISASGEITLTGSFDAVEITDPNAVLHLAGGTVKNLEVAKGAGNTQISLESGASVTNTEVQTAGAVQLNGSFENVQLSAAGTSLNLEGGTIQNLSVTKDSVSAKIDLGAGTNVTNLVLGSAATVTGGGHIRAASILASGSSIAQQPGSTALPSGVTATVNGVKMTGSSGTSGNIAGNAGNGSGSSGNGATIDLSGLIQSQLASVSISGSPSLTYNGSSFTYNLWNLTLSGKNHSGNAMDLSWFPVTWTVVSGPASVSGYSMTVSGSGSVTVRATVYGVASNELTLKVEKASPVLWKLVVSGSPSLTYNGSSLTYDLSRLTLTGQDQFGNAYDLTGKTVTWGVVSGPARIQGNIMTVTGSGTIVVQASAQGRGSNQQTIPVVPGLPVLTNLKIFGNPALAYGGRAFNFDLNDLKLVGRDQFGNPYSFDKKQVEWLLISGPATLSGSTLTVTGSGAIVVAAKVNGIVSESQTLTVAGATPSLTNLILSGSPALTYNGSNFTYNLGGLSLSGKDESGKAYDLTGKSVEWSVISGPASVSGNTLTITGSGTVVVAAKINGIISNNLTLAVAGATPSLTNLILSGSPALTYNGSNFTYNLGGLSLSGKDESGKAYDLTGKSVEWSVISGPASVSGNTLTITGSGTVVVAAKINGIISNNLTLAVAGATPSLTNLILSGSPALTYNGSSFTYNLGGLSLSGKDESGKAYDLTGKAVEWSVISGPASVSGNTLTVTASGAVVVSAAVDGVASNRLTLTVNSAAPAFSGLQLSGNPLLVNWGKGDPVSLDLSTLTLVGKDQFGGNFDLGGRTVSWSVVSGEAGISGNILTVTGSGLIVIQASADGVISNRLTLKVYGMTPELARLQVTGSPYLTYDNAAFVYDLSILSLAGQNQFFGDYDVAGRPVTWSVVSGPATVSGNSLTVTGTGSVVVTATVDGVTSDTFTFEVRGSSSHTPVLTQLVLSGNLNLLYNGSGAPFTYDLSGLTLTAYDQNGKAFDLTGKTLTWGVGYGPATVEGSTLTVTGSGGLSVSVSVDGVSSNSLQLPISNAPSIVTGLILNGDISPITCNYSYVYDLTGLNLQAVDQFGSAFSTDGKTVKWNVVSGPARVSGNLLILTGAGMYTVSAAIDGVSSNELMLRGVLPSLTGMTISGNPSLTYSGQDLTYDLSGLSVTGTDQFGNAFPISGWQPEWTVISGPASISSADHRTLTITGSGPVVIRADSNSGVFSNELTLTVNRASSALTGLSLAGDPNLIYSNSDFTYDLASLTLVGLDQYGGEYDISGQTVTWSVSGPAAVSGHMLNVTGVGTVTLTAEVGGKTSNELSLTVYSETPQLKTLTLSGTPSLTYNAQEGYYNLDGLSLAGSDQFGNTSDISGQPVAWSIISGPASVRGGTLTITGSGPVVLKASAEGVWSNELTLTVSKAASVLNGVTLSGDPHLTYDGKDLLYSLTGLSLAGVDQFGEAYDISGQTVTWNVSGPATVTGQTMTVTGSGTVEITATVDGITSPVLYSNVGMAAERLADICLSGNWKPVYNIAFGRFSQYDITSYVTGVDQFGNRYSLDGQPVTWSVVSGPASFVGSQLTVTGIGPIVIQAAMNGVSTNRITLTATRAPSVLSSVTLSGSNDRVYYNNKDITFDLGGLTLSARDQFGSSYDLTGKTVTWMVQGPATLSGHTLTITGAGQVAVTATVDGVQADAFTIYSEMGVPVLGTLSLSGSPTLTYNGVNSNYILQNILTLGGTDQFANPYSITGHEITWAVVSGPANVIGQVLNLTGSGTVTLRATVDGVASNTLTLAVGRAAPVVSHLSFAGCPTLTYDGVQTTFNLSELRLSGTDQFGDYIDAPGQIIWSASAGGNASCSLSGAVLTYSGYGEISVTAGTADYMNTGIYAMETLTVAKAAPRLTTITCSGSPVMVNDGAGISYDLASIDLSAKDQFGDGVNISDKAVVWKVISGPAEVAGNIVTSTGHGTAVVQPTIDGVAGSEIELTMSSGIDILSLSGNPYLLYDGSAFSCDLSSGWLHASDEYGNTFTVNSADITWHVTDGPAYISGDTLTITGSGTVSLTASVGSSQSNVLQLSVDRKASRLVSLTLGGAPSLSYDGSPVTYRLSGLTMTGKDQYGNAVDLSGKNILWTVVGASENNGVITVSSNSLVGVQAAVDGAVSNYLSFYVNKADSVLASLSLAGAGDVSYNGGTTAYDLNNLDLTAKDQFGTYISVGNVTWSVVSGHAAVDGNTLSLSGAGTVVLRAASGGVTSNDLTVNVVRAQPYFASLSIAGNSSSSLTYSGRPVTCDLSGLTVALKDQFGEACDFSNNALLSWTLISGPATLSGSKLTVSGDGTVVVAASLYSLTSNRLSLTVSRAAPALKALSLSGSASGLTYNAEPLTYNLNNLSLSGMDQFGSAYSLTGKTVVWSVVSGPAAVSGSTLTVTGSGTVTLTAAVEGVTSGSINITVGKAASVLTGLAMSLSQPTYSGSALSYQLADLSVSGVDQFGDTCDVSGLTKTFHVLSGPASVSGNMLTVTGSGTVELSVTAGSVSAQFAVEVLRAAPSLSSVTLSGNLNASDYNGVSYNRDLDGLTLSGTDQFGNSFDLSGKAVTWKLISGQGSLTGKTLTVTGSGTIVLAAVVGGVTSNSFSIAVGRAAPALTALTMDGITGLVYNGSPLNVSLSNLNLSGTDQFGIYYSLNGSSVNWSVTGPASISGGMLTVTGDGTVTVTATAGGISVTKTMTVSRETPTLAGVTLTGQQTFLYNGSNFTCDLNSLALTGVDQFGNAFDLAGTAKTWNWVSGPASTVITGGILTATDSGTVAVTVKIGSFVFGPLTLTIGRAAPVLSTLNLSGKPYLTYDGVQTTYDLSGLNLTGLTQYGRSVDLTGQTAIWSVTSGPASVSGSILTITGSDPITVSVRIGNAAVSLTLSVNHLAQPQLTGAAVSPDGAAVTLTFDQPMALPAGTSGFTVMAGGQAQTVSGVAYGAGRTELVLTLAAPVCTGNITVGAASGSLTGENGAAFALLESAQVSGSVDAASVASALYRAGMDAAAAAGKLKDAFSPNSAQLALWLRQAGYDAASAGRALQTVLAPSVQELASDLVSAGYVSADVASVLKNLYQQDARTAAVTLTASGVSADDLGKALNSVYQTTADDFAVLAGSMGFDAVTAAQALWQDYYGADTVSGEMPTLYSLEKASYLTVDFVRVCQNLFHSDAAAAWNLLSNTSFAKADLFNAATQFYSFTDLVNALKTDNYTVDMAAGLLQEAGIDGIRAGKALLVFNTSMTGTDLAAIMERTHFGILKTGNALIGVFHVSDPSEMFTDLADCFQEGEIENFLITGMGVGAQQLVKAETANNILKQNIIAMLKMNFSMSAADAVQTMLDAGWSDEQAGGGMKNLILCAEDVYGLTTAESIVGLLRQMKMPGDQMLDTLMKLRFSGADALINASTIWPICSELGYTASDLAKWDVANGYTMDQVFGTFLEYGSTVNDMAQALCSVYHLSIAQTIRELYERHVGTMSEIVTAAESVYGVTDAVPAMLQGMSAQSLGTLSSLLMAIGVDSMSAYRYLTGAGYDGYKAVEGLKCYGLSAYPSPASITFGGNPNLVYNGGTLSYKMRNLQLNITDQYGHAMDSGDMEVTWSLISGPAAIAGNTLSVTGSGDIVVTATAGGVTSGRLTLSVSPAHPELGKLVVSEGSTILYGMKPVDYDLSVLTLKGYDQYGNPFDISGDAVTWSLVQGIASISGGTLTVNGFSDPYVQAEVNGVTSNIFTLDVELAPPALARVTVYDSPQIVYRGMPCTYDLSRLSVRFFDEYNNIYDVSGIQKIWSVLSGNATVSGNMLTVTDGQPVTLELTADGVTSAPIIIRPNILSQPVLSGAAAGMDGMSIVLTFDQPMAIAPDGESGFTVTMNGTPVTVSGVTRSGTNLNEYILTLASRVYGGSVSVSYQKDNVTTNIGVWLNSFSGKPVSANLDPAAVAASLHAQGTAASDAASTLTAIFGTTSITQSNIASLMKSVGYDAASAALVLSASYSAGAAQAGGLLHGAGYDASAIASALKTVYAKNDSDTASILAGAGFGYGDAAQALKDAFTDSDAEMAAILHTEGCGVNDLSGLLKKVYSDSDAAADQILKAEAFSLQDRADALLNIYQDGAIAAAGVLLQNGADTANTAAALLAVYGLSDSSMVAALHNRTNNASILSVLEGSIYSDDESTATKALKAGGLLAAEIAALFGSNDDAAVAALLKTLGYGVDDIARVLKSSPYADGDRAAAGALVGAGYAEAAVLSELENLYGDDLNTAAIAMLRAGATSAATITALESSPNNKTDADVAKLYHSAGISASTFLLNVCLTLYGKDHEQYYYAALLGGTGYTAEETAAALQSCMGLTAENIYYSMASNPTWIYSETDTLTAISSLFGADAAGRILWNVGGVRTSEYIGRMLAVGVSMDDTAKSLSNLGLSVGNIVEWFKPYGLESTASVLRNGLGIHDIYVLADCLSRCYSAEDTARYLIDKLNVTPAEMANILQKTSGWYLSTAKIVALLGRLYSLTPVKIAQIMYSDGVNLDVLVHGVLEAYNGDADMALSILEELPIDPQTLLTEMYQNGNYRNLSTIYPAIIPAQDEETRLHAGLENNIFNLIYEGYSPADIAAAMLKLYNARESDVLHYFSMATNSRLSDAEMQHEVDAVYALGGLMTMELDDLQKMQSAGRSSVMAASYLRYTVGFVDPDQAAVCLILAGYGTGDAAAGLSAAYGISNADALKMTGNGYSSKSIYQTIAANEKQSGCLAADAAMNLRFASRVSAADAAYYLYQAGYDVSSVVAAVMQAYNVNLSQAAGDVAQAATYSGSGKVLQQYVNSLAKNGKTAADAASALYVGQVTDAQLAVDLLLGAGYKEVETADAVSASYGISVSDVLNMAANTESLSSPDSIVLQYIESRINSGNTENEILEVIAGLGIGDAQTAARYLAEAGYDAVSAAQALSKQFRISIYIAAGLVAAAENKDTDTLIENCVERQISPSGTALLAASVLSDFFEVSEIQNAAAMLLDMKFEALDIVDAIRSVYKSDMKSDISAVSQAFGYTGNSAVMERYGGRLRQRGTTAVQTASLCRNTMGFDTQQTSNVLISSGYAPLDAAAALKDTFGVSLRAGIDSAAQSEGLTGSDSLLVSYLMNLKKTGGSVAALGAALKGTLEVTNSQEATQDLIACGYSALDTAEAVADVYGIDEATAINLATAASALADSSTLILQKMSQLKDAGSSESAVAAALKGTLGITDAQQVTDYLIRSGYAAVDTATVIASLFSVSGADALGMVQIAQSLGWGDSQTVRSLENAKAEGKSAQEIVESLFRDFNVSDVSRAAEYLIGLGYGETETAAALSSVYGVGADDAQRIVAAAKGDTQADEQNRQTVAGLYAQNVSAADAAGQIKNAMGVTVASTAAGYLIDAGYDPLSVQNALAEAYSLSLSDTAFLVAKAMGFSSADSLYLQYIKADKESGNSAEAEASLLKNHYGTGDYQKAVQLLIEAGYSGKDTALAVGKAYGVDMSNTFHAAAEVLGTPASVLYAAAVQAEYDAGASAQNAADFAKNILFIGSVPDALGYLLGAGYDAYSSAAALADVYTDSMADVMTTLAQLLFSKYPDKVYPAAKAYVGSGNSSRVVYNMLHAIGFTDRQISNYLIEDGYSNLLAIDAFSDDPVNQFVTPANVHDVANSLSLSSIENLTELYMRQLVQGGRSVNDLIRYLASLGYGESDADTILLKAGAPAADIAFYGIFHGYVGNDWADYATYEAAAQAVGLTTPDGIIADYVRQGSVSDAEKVGILHQDYHFDIDRGARVLAAAGFTAQRMLRAMRYEWSDNIKETMHAIAQAQGYANDNPVIEAFIQNKIAADQNIMPLDQIVWGITCDLSGSGYTAREIASSELKAQIQSDYIIKSLAGCAYGSNVYDMVQAVKDVTAEAENIGDMSELTYANTAKEYRSKGYDASYTDRQLKEAGITDFVKRAAAMLAAGYSAADVSAAGTADGVSDISGTINQAQALLNQNDLADIGSKLSGITSPADAVAALSSYGILEITGVLQSFYRLTQDQAASVLLAAGYGAIDAACTTDAVYQNKWGGYLFKDTINVNVYPLMAALQELRRIWTDGFDLGRTMLDLGYQADDVVTCGCEIYSWKDPEPISKLLIELFGNDPDICLLHLSKDVQYNLETLIPVARYLYPGASNGELFLKAVKVGKVPTAYVSFDDNIHTWMYYNFDDSVNRVLEEAGIPLQTAEDVCELSRHDNTAASCGTFFQTGGYSRSDVLQAVFTISHELTEWTYGPIGYNYTDGSLATARVIWAAANGYTLAEMAADEKYAFNTDYMCGYVNQSETTHIFVGYIKAGFSLVDVCAGFYEGGIFPSSDWFQGVSDICSELGCGDPYQIADTLFEIANRCDGTIFDVSNGFINCGYYGDDTVFDLMDYISKKYLAVVDSDISTMEFSIYLMHHAGWGADRVAQYTAYKLFDGFSFWKFLKDGFPDFSEAIIDMVAGGYDPVVASSAILDNEDWKMVITLDVISTIVGSIKDEALSTGEKIFKKLITKVMLKDSFTKEVKNAVVGVVKNTMKKYLE